MTGIQISIMISISSLILGFGAWLFGILAISRASGSSSTPNTVISFSFCSASLLLQLFEIQNRVNINDYAAISDTIGATLFAAIILVLVTIILNIIAVMKLRK